MTKSALEYARRLYQNVLDWYDSAEKKAQVILTIDGILLTFLTSSMFTHRSDLDEILHTAGYLTWLFLAPMPVCLVGSIASALGCLWSRTFTKRKLHQYLASVGTSREDLDTYGPEAMWFFQMIAGLDQKSFQERMLWVNREFEIRALASQISILSANVSKKHRCVNWGFVLVGISLILSLLAGICYLFRL